MAIKLRESEVPLIWVMRLKQHGSGSYGTHGLHFKGDSLFQYKTEVARRITVADVDHIVTRIAYQNVALCCSKFNNPMEPVMALGLPVVRNVGNHSGGINPVLYPDGVPPNVLDWELNNLRLAVEEIPYPSRGIWFQDFFASTNMLVSLKAAVEQYAKVMGPRDSTSFAACAQDKLNAYRKVYLEKGVSTTR